MPSIIVPIIAGATGADVLTLAKIVNTLAKALRALQTVRDGSDKRNLFSAILASARIDHADARRIAVNVDVLRDVFRAERKERVAIVRNPLLKLHQTTDASRAIVAIDKAQQALCDIDQHRTLIVDESAAVAA